MAPRRQKKPHDLTPEQETTFFSVLADSANVSRALKESGISRCHAYRLRRTEEVFAERWTEALEIACDAMEEEARRRAMEGVQKPVYHRGECVGHVTEYSDPLLQFLLKGNRPEKYRERQSVEHTGSITVEIVC